MDGPTVYVVDNEDAIRRSLTRLLESVSLPVKTFASGQAFLDHVKPEMPGCLILDVIMPGMSGLELQSELIRRRILLPVIIITGHADVPTAVQALKAGAMDLIEKPYSGQKLLTMVQEALEMDAEQRDRHLRCQEIEQRLALLFPRERQVMEGITHGKLSKQIAAEMGISERTVEDHRARVMAKMEAPSVADLVRQATFLDQEREQP